jgi:hypothetical protein
MTVTGHRALSSITPFMLITFNRMGRKFDRRVGAGSEQVTLSASRSSLLQPGRHLNGAAQGRSVHNKTQQSAKKDTVDE